MNQTKQRKRRAVVLKTSPLSSVKSFKYRSPAVRETANREGTWFTQALYSKLQSVSLIPDVYLLDRIRLLAHEKQVTTLWAGPQILQCH